MPRDWVLRALVARRGSQQPVPGALRRLANRLVGILQGCLKTRTFHDEATPCGHRQNLTQSSVTA